MTSPDDVIFLKFSEIHGQYFPLSNFKKKDTLVFSSLSSIRLGLSPKGLVKRKRPSEGQHFIVSHTKTHKITYIIYSEPVNGGFSEWGKWTKCSADCGLRGTQSRYRTCTNPAPAYGGSDCQGGVKSDRQCTTTCSGGKKYPNFVFATFPNNPSY